MKADQTGDMALVHAAHEICSVYSTARVHNNSLKCSCFAVLSYFMYSLIPDLLCPFHICLIFLCSS